MTATSSAVVERTVPSPSAAAAAPDAWTWPNAPNRTFVTERFIARAIISVSSVPGGADERAAHDQDVLVQARSRSPPRPGR